MPTQADLNPPAPPTGHVEVGPGSAPNGPTRITQRTAPPADPEPTPDGDDRTHTGTAPGPVARGPEPVPPSPEPQPQPRNNSRGAPRPGDPRELVLHHPEDFQADGPGGGGGATPAGDSVTPKPTTGQTRGPAAPKSYTAEPGDSVSRIAAKMYGANTKTNRDLIIRANPPLQAEGNPVIVGKTYVIPNAPAAAAAPSKPARQPNEGNSIASGDPAGSNGDGAGAAPRSNGRKPAPAPAAGPGQVWYTVKDNDNLWKIAEAQLGTGNAWTQIRDLNKDVLKGGETVRPNMRIRLPARSSSVATVPTN